ncbi:MAG: hypothetical protein AB8G22_19870 [Saprospiraceae bacterium]
MNGEHHSDSKKIQQIQAILLRKERAELLEIREQLAQRDATVQQMIDEKLTYFQSHFPMEFEIGLNKIIERKIENSQEKLLDAIYPVLGKMIRKYIALQFEQLQQRIDQQLNQGFIGRLRNMFSGVKESEIVMSQIPDSGVEEVFVIQKYSGLLLGSASAEETINSDVIAGMLTAIKSFVEDAFKREDEDLEMIQYGSYSIIIQNFYSYYIAIAVKGKLTISQKSDLYSKSLELGEQHLPNLVSNPTNTTHLLIKNKLEATFFSHLVLAT